MDYSEKAKEYFEKKDYVGNFENAKKQYELTKSMKDKKEVEKAERMLRMYEETQDFLKKPRLDYYGVLNVPRDAPQEEILKAFRRLVVKFHPSKNNVKETSKVFEMVQEAYDTLRNPEKKKEYDTRLRFGGMSGNTRFRNSNDRNVAEDLFFNQFNFPGYGTHIYSSRDLYEHIYTHMNRGFQHRNIHMRGEMSPQMMAFMVVVILLLFLI